LASGLDAAGVVFSDALSMGILLLGNDFLAFLTSSRLML